MFDERSKQPNQSLLTLAVDNAGEPVRRSRRHAASYSGSLLNALGTAQAKPTAPPPAGDDAGMSQIEREIDDIMHDVNAAQAPSAARQPSRSPPPSPSHAVAPAHTAAAPAPVSEALLDPVIIARTMWRWRWPIVGTTLAGAALGVLIALQTPTTFTSTAQVTLDPRELRLIERDLTPEFLSNEGSLAIVDSQLQSAFSARVLRQVVKNTNLDQDPEFNGTGDAGPGLLDGIALIRSLFSNETSVDRSERVTLDNLRNALEAERSSSTFVLNFSATSRSPDKAALLANEHAKAFIDRQSAFESDTAASASSALSNRLETLETDLRAAQARLADFRAAKNIFGENGDELGQDEVSSLNSRLIDARTETTQARSRAQAAQRIDVSSVIRGAVPSDLTTPALTTFRAQYASLRQNEANLAASLGPRHPRLVNARASVEAARSDIEAEVRRIITSAQDELQRAIQTEQEINSRLGAASVDLGESNQLIAELRKLQNDVAAAETIYRNALVRSREANEIGELGRVNATISAPAEPPLVKSSASRSVIATAGAMGGFGFGLAMAFLAGSYNSIRARFEMRAAGPAQNATTPSGPPPNGGHRTQTQSSDTGDTSMYPHSNAYPYAPHPTQQAAPVGHAAPQPVYPHPTAPMPAPHYAQPTYAPPMQPQPQPQPAPYHPQAPAPAPATAYSPYAPVPTQPPQQGYPYGQPQLQPQAPQPVYAQPQPHQPSVVFVQSPPVQQQAPASDPTHDAELDHLRQSVSDIREVVEHLIAQRRDRRSHG